MECKEHLHQLTQTADVTDRLMWVNKENRGRTEEDSEGWEGVINQNSAINPNEESLEGQG